MHYYTCFLQAILNIILPFFSDPTTPNIDVKCGGLILVHFYGGYVCHYLVFERNKKKFG